jgi:hypothetical protein
VSVKWAEEVRQRNKTKGGLVADAIGLGKTMEYGTIILVVSCPYDPSRKAFFRSPMLRFTYIRY